MKRTPLKPKLRLLTLFVTLLSLIGLLSATAFALEFDGTAGSGESGGSQSANGGYSIPTPWALGYGDPLQ